MLRCCWTTSASVPWRSAVHGGHYELGAALGRGRAFGYHLNPIPRTKERADIAIWRQGAQYTSDIQFQLLLRFRDLVLRFIQQVSVTFMVQVSRHTIMIQHVLQLQTSLVGAGLTHLHTANYLQLWDFLQTLAYFMLSGSLHNKQRQTWFKMGGVYSSDGHCGGECNTDTLGYVAKLLVSTKEYNQRAP